MNVRPRPRSISSSARAARPFATTTPARIGRSGQLLVRHDSPLTQRSPGARVVRNAQNAPGGPGNAPRARPCHLITFLAVGTILCPYRLRRRNPDAERGSAPPQPCRTLRYRRNEDDRFLYEGSRV